MSNKIPAGAEPAVYKNNHHQFVAVLLLGDKCVAAVLLAPKEDAEKWLNLTTWEELTDWWGAEQAAITFYPRFYTRVDTEIVARAEARRLREQQNETARVARRRERGLTTWELVETIYSRDFVMESYSPEELRKWRTVSLEGEEFFVFMLTTHDEVVGFASTPSGESIYHTPDGSRWTVTTGKSDLDALEALTFAELKRVQDKMYLGPPTWSLFNRDGFF